MHLSGTGEARLQGFVARDVVASLSALLDDRVADAFNYAAALAVIAALVIMVWKPSRYG